MFRSNDNGAVQAMVRAGMGQAILGYLAVDLDDAGVVVQELEPPIPPRIIQVATLADRTLGPAVRAVIDVAVEVCAELGHPRARAV